MQHNQILKYLSDNNYVHDIKVDTESLFLLVDNKDDKELALEWNVPGVAKPKPSDLPSVVDADNWAKGKRNEGKINRVDWEGATTVPQIKAQLEIYLNQLGMFEE